MTIKTTKLFESVAVTMDDDDEELSKVLDKARQTIIASIDAEWNTDCEEMVDFYAAKIARHDGKLTVFMDLESTHGDELKALMLQAVEVEYTLSQDDKVLILSDSNDLSQDDCCCGGVWDVWAKAMTRMPADRDAED